jgi:hypothetical protein
MDFVTRIGLEDGEASYEALDKAMFAQNFATTYVSKEGIEYRLPRGTYFSQSFTITANDVVNFAIAAAVSTGKRYDIITTAGEIAYSLHPAR